MATTDTQAIKVRLLEDVTSRKSKRDRATLDFEASVHEAKKYGASIREIAEAAGYDSHSAIQQILNKHT